MALKFLVALFFLGDCSGKFQTDAKTWRFGVVIANVVKQSLRAANAKQDCFALLAMTNSHLALLNRINKKHIFLRNLR